MTGRRFRLPRWGGFFFFGGGGGPPLFSSNHVSEQTREIPLFGDVPMRRQRIFATWRKPGPWGIDIGTGNLIVRDAKGPPPPIRG